LIPLFAFPAQVGAEDKSAAVRRIKTPDGGIQPQAVVDSQGTVHLLYFKGEPRAGDLFYVQRAAGQERFSKPVRVNSVAGSAVAVGTIRGGQLAIGKDGDVHVAWNGSYAASKQSPPEMPMLYSRRAAGSAEFEPQRNLMTQTHGLDGGGTVAADAAGNVFVA